MAYLSKANLLSPEACTKIGLWVNIALAAFKFAAGLLGHSQAMLADSMHSLSDVLATGVVFIGLKAAARPADESHPYGHGGIDTLVAVAVTLTLIATGLIIGLGAIKCLFARTYEAPLPIALYAAVISIGLKEGLFRYTIKVGRQSNSPSVIANAWDHRADAYSSVGALVGIAGARLGYPYLDPVAGIFIAYMIIKISVDLFKANVGEVVHAAPPRRVIDQIKKEAMNVAGVQGVRALRMHRVGRTNFLDINIYVEGRISVAEGHRIATLVKRHLSKTIEHISDVMVHVEPSPEEEA